MAALPRSAVPEGEPPYHFSADEAQIVGLAGVIRAANRFSDLG